MPLNHHNMYDSQHFKMCLKVDAYNDEDLPDDVLAADEVPPAFSCLSPLPPLTNYKLMIV